MGNSIHVIIEDTKADSEVSAKDSFRFVPPGVARCPSSTRAMMSGCMVHRGKAFYQDGLFSGGLAVRLSKRVWGSGNLLWQQCCSSTGTGGSSRTRERGFCTKRTRPDLHHIKPLFTPFPRKENIHAGPRRFSAAPKSQKGARNGKHPTPQPFRLFR